MSENVYVIQRTDYAWSVRNEKGPQEPACICVEKGWFASEQAAEKAAAVANRLVQAEMDKDLAKAEEVREFIRAHNAHIKEGQRMRISAFNYVDPIAEPRSPEYSSLREYARKKRYKFYEVACLARNGES